MLTEVLILFGPRRDQRTLTTPDGTQLEIVEASAKRVRLVRIKPRVVHEGLLRSEEPVSLADS